MKKLGVLILFIAFLIPFISGANNTKIEAGFDCLEEKAGDCSDLTNQEIALTILATPEKIYNDCLTELKSRKTGNNWGNVRDTALAILALQHSSEDTKAYEEWLLSQTETPSDLIWYLEEDSEGDTECHVGYRSNDYTINVGENKKIDTNAGTCLTRAQSNYWFQISPECYDEEFTLECNKDFITSLLYKNKNSPTIYVTKGSVTTPALSGSVKIKINSKCFGDGKCDYEGTLWATLALLKTGYDIEEYIPYVIAMSDSNKNYLPNSFIYMITSYDAYATKLISEQKLGNYWEADGTSYTRFYDTALALLAIKTSNSETVTKSKEWLLFSQKSDGCWGNIRDTAIVLWALEGRAGKKGNGTKVEYCTSSNFFCIPTSECSGTDKLDNYYCSLPGETCCKNENLKSCSDYSGKVCDDEEICTGNVKRATDTSKCCTGECKEREPDESQCENFGYLCSEECTSGQESIDYECNGGLLCCRTKTETPSNNSWWVWVLVILIILVIAAIAWVKREKLKLEWFKLKTRFRKDRGGGRPPMNGPGPSTPQGMPPMPPRGTPRFPPHTGFPAKPGFPPVRRPQPPVPPRKPLGEDKEMSEVFKKLRDMSGQDSK